MRSLSLLYCGMVLAAVLSAAGGCGESATTPPPPEYPPDTLPFPDTPDRAAANLREAYERMDLDDLDDLLTGDYVMPLQALAAAWYPDLGGAIERHEAMRIHERLFSRQDVTDPDGQLVPAVAAIAFQTFERTGEWALAGSGDPYPGAQAAFHEVVVLLDRGPARTLLKVQGTLRLHVSERDSLVGGETRPYYTLRAITDLTEDTKALPGADKATEPVSLGRLLGLWR